MLRTILALPRTDVAWPVKPVAVGAAAAGVLLLDPTAGGLGLEEVVYIRIFNAGANDVYYNLGAQCDNLFDYCGIIPTKTWVEVPTRMSPIYGYSVAGSTVSFTVVVRKQALSNLT